MQYEILIACKCVCFKMVPIMQNKHFNLHGNSKKHKGQEMGSQNYGEHPM